MCVSVDSKLRGSRELVVLVEDCKAEGSQGEAGSGSVRDRWGGRVMSMWR
jgi:hypothetical protein